MDHRGPRAAEIRLDNFSCALYSSRWLLVYVVMIMHMYSTVGDGRMKDVQGRHGQLVHVESLS